MHKFYLSLNYLFLLSCCWLNAQPNKLPSHEGYREYIDDAYIPVNRLSFNTSPRFEQRSAGFFAIQVNTDAEGRNILGDAANEPSIAVDPTNPNRMVMGWRQFATTASNFRQAGVGYSFDGGESWTYPGNIETGIFRSDPVLDADASGRFYYSSLTITDGEILMDVFRTTGDMSWDEGVFALGGDKQWMAIDRTDGTGEGHIYSSWSRNFSVCAPGYFNRSVDRGESYESCVGIGDRVISFATLAVGPEGDLYIGGVEGDRVLVAKSTSAKDPANPVSWEQIVEVDLRGSRRLRRTVPDPNPGGLLGQTWITADQSDGPTRGNVYLLSSVERTDTADVLDVMFSRSEDGGRTWSPALRLNDDSRGDAWQWFGTMSVAPNGRIDVAWLDTRLDPDGFDSALFYTYSVDGGNTWSGNQQLSETFDPHLGWPQQNKLGDYFDMVSDDEHAHLAWAGTFNGEQDVYYGRITPEVMATSISNPVPSFPVRVYPNPFTQRSYIEYRVRQASHVRLEIVDGTGKLVGVPVEGVRSPGQHVEEWSGPPGIYFYQLTIDGNVRTGKLISQRGW